MKTRSFYRVHSEVVLHIALLCAGLFVIGCDTMLGVSREASLAPCDEGQRRCAGNQPQECIRFEWHNAEACPPETPVCAGDGECSRIKTISAGGHHACALVESDGSLRCWGGNESGQLGNGTTLPARGSQRISTLTNVHEIEAGGHDDAGFSCAVNAENNVLCWGDNFSGQLGSGDQQPHYLPEVIEGLSNVTKLALGSRHACAITGDERVWCWGSNLTELFETSPKEISELSHVKQIDAGGRHTCAIDTKGDVYCWGYNGDGQCGQPIEQEFVLKPTPVGGIANATKLAAGYFHTCVLAQGQVYCWGRNDCGQLGRGTYCGNACPQPVEKKACGDFVPALANLPVNEYLDLDLGSHHSCVLKKSGTVSCWGRSDYAQAGVSNSPITNMGAIFFTAPAATGVTHATTLSLGSYFACVTTDARGAHCWGRNDYGQLGIDESVQW